MVGSFAPGHLGELTQHLSFEMLDAACEETDIEQKRVRDLPSRVVVYLLLAACLFPDAGYQGVWRKLTAGLHAPAPAAPAGSALAQARRRIGPAPLRWLFELLRAPAGATPGRNGVWFKGLLVTAIDSTILTVPDTGAVRTRFTKQAGNHGGTGYPQVRLLALVSCRTRAQVDAVYVDTTVGETSYVPRLLASMRAGVIILSDRNFDAKDVPAGIAGTGADFLVRAESIRRLPVLARHHDGSFVSQIAGLLVRVIDAEVTITTKAGSTATQLPTADDRRRLLPRHRPVPLPDPGRPVRVVVHHRRADLAEPLDLRWRQRQLSRADVVAQLLERAGTDDHRGHGGLRGEPRERHLGL